MLYAQNARPMLVNAAWLTLIAWGLLLGVFVVMLAPAAVVVWLIPGSWSAGGVVIALVFARAFAWTVKAALWRAKLERASAKFKALGDRAAGWIGRKVGV